MLIGGGSTGAPHPHAPSVVGGPGAPIAPPTTTSTTPDYASLLQNDPGFAALKQQLSAQGIQDASQRQAATAQALIQFGMVPDFNSLGNLGLSQSAISMLQGDISPQVAALAQQNTANGLSTQAQLQQQQQQAMLALRNGLAARGGLSSGDDAYRTNLQNQAYAQAQNNALLSLLSAIGGYQQTYLTNQQNEQGQLATGLAQAEANMPNLYPNGVPLPVSYGSPGPIFLTK